MNKKSTNSLGRLSAAVAASLLLGAGIVNSNAADGTWNNAAGGIWSTSGNWAGGNIADGANSTVFFNTLDLTADTAVSLDTARTLGNVVFSDTDPINTPASWTLSGGPLTLSGDTPSITVNALGESKSATISAALVGQGFTKSGAGMLTLSAANTMVGTNQINAGLVSYANATALGGASNTMLFNGGGIYFPSGAPALSLTNMIVLSSATIITTNGNYDNFMNQGGSISGDANSVIVIRGNNRFTPGGTGGSSWNMFKTFFGTIDMADSGSSTRVRLNLGATNIYDLSTVTINTGTNAGIMYFRTTTAGTVVKIGAIKGDGVNAGFQASEQSGNPLLTWLIGYLNTDNVFYGRFSDTSAARQGALTKVGTGRLTLAGTVYNYTGNTTVSNGVLALTNAVNLTGTPVISVYNPGVFDVSGLTNDLGPNAPWSLRTGEVLAGSGTVLGNIALTNGTLIPGSNAVGTLTFNSLTLSDGASAQMQIVSPAASDKITVNGDLSLTGASTVQLVPNPADVIITNGTYVLFEWTGSLNGDPANVTFNYPFQLGTINIATNASKQMVMTVSGASLIDLTWRGDLSGEWSGAANWRDTNNAATTWADGRVAHLDESGFNKTINLSATVSPARVLVDTTSDYTIGTSGGGKISGSGVLVKSGTGKLTLALDNDYTGATTINQGTLQLGANGTTGTASGSIVIQPDGALALNRSDDLVLSQGISGSGTLIHNGTGQLTITTAVPFAGITSNSGGLLQLGDGTAGHNGTIGGTVIIPSGKSISYNYIGSDNVTAQNGISGSGSATFAFTTPRTITFANTVTNTGFTGTADIKINTRVEVGTAAASLSGPIIVESSGQTPDISTDGAYYTHVSGFTNYNSITIAGYGPASPVDTPRGKGALRLGNTWAGPITLSANATIGGGTGTIIGNISDGGNNFTLEYIGGIVQVGPTTGNNAYGATVISEDYFGNFSAATLTTVQALNSNPFGSGPINMVGRSRLELNGNIISIANLGDIPALAGSNFPPVVANNSTTLAGTLTIGTDNNDGLFSGQFIDGSTQPLGVTKAGSGTLTLSGDSTSTGPVTVSAGTLKLASASGSYFNGQPILGSGSFSNASAFAVATGATLDVSGRSGGTMTLNANQTLKHSGAGTGTITVAGNVNIGNGTLLLGVNHAGLAHDSTAGSITYSGTLAVTNIGAALQAGDVFQLFASGTSGFTAYNLQTNDVVNNVKYDWINTVASDGKITVQNVSPLVNTTPTNITAVASGSTLDLSWPEDHQGWTLQTNAVSVTDPAAWFEYPAGTGSRNTNHVIHTIDQTKANVFFRLVYP